MMNQAAEIEVDGVTVDMKANSVSEGAHMNPGVQRISEVNLLLGRPRRRYERSQYE
ncbi:hypothetical protein D3C73_1666540 [compost metagenome]